MLINKFSMILLSGLFLFSACSKKAKEGEIIFEAVRSLGYVPFRLPIGDSSPGTLVGGTARDLHLLALPPTCFPFVSDPDHPETAISESSVVIPSSYKTTAFKGKTKIALSEALEAGYPGIKFNGDFNQYSKVELTIKGAKMVFFDVIKLSHFVRNSLRGDCRDYLSKVGFIIDALAIEELHFEFYDKQNHRVQLDVENIEGVLDVGADFVWSIEEGVRLEVKGRKYIGARLGVLRKNDDEQLLLYRSSEVDRKDRFIFSPIALIEDEEKQQSEEDMGYDDFDDDEIELKELK